MRIAILGWGSLLWEEREEFDRQHRPWEYDGPTLKLEFSRISSSRLGALTLVIDYEHGFYTKVAWCLSKRNDPEEAICDLRCREGTTLSNIGRVFPSNPERNHFRGDKAYTAIHSWVTAKHLDAVVWTDLVSNFKVERGNPFSIQEALTYLKSLTPPSKVKAIEYIWRAPDFVKTPLREALQQEPWFQDGVAKLPAA